MPKKKEDIKLPTADDRVFITLPYAGLRAMQVCALPEATDEEILEKCNRENSQRVTGGWHTVVRSRPHARECHVDEDAAPGACEDCPGRLHKIVLCM